mmetsp:Transcript_2845/g.4059  ORF Transcript_2845/g.4059 Transcript_2845/m.4059 type:complete len:569 (+) Transcript_2845:63-1769(+)
MKFHYLQGARLANRSLPFTKSALIFCGGAILAWEDGREKCTDVFQGISRFSTAFCFASMHMLEYKFKLKDYGDGDPEGEQLRYSIHEKGADRLLYVCKKHGGLYTKLGQYVASMDHVLPKPYTEKLKILQDRNHHMSVHDVKKVIRRNFGKETEEIFHNFSTEPIAAASLAQVHEATTKNGMLVAVKLQYPWLQRQVAYDLFTLKILALLVGKLFPEYEYSWMLPDFEGITKLELDFVQEATNSDRVSKMFQSHEDVHVPAVHWDLTTHEVLVMEFIQGCKVNDIEKLKLFGFKPVDVAKTVTEVFAEMAFFHGFVQCDPHPGNLMVRPTPGNPDKYQLVLLDHGMYRRLDPIFRHNYCLLWKSFLTRNHKLGAESVLKLGLDPHFYEALSMWFTYRPPDSKAKMGSRVTLEEREKLREKYEKKFSPEDLNKFLETMPRDMHFVSRSNNLIRSVNRDLGGTTRARLKIFGQYAVKGLTLSHPHAGNTEFWLKHNIFLNKTLGEVAVLPLNPDALVNHSVVSEMTEYSQPFSVQVDQLKMRFWLWITDSLFGIVWWWQGKKSFTKTDLG